MKRLVKIEKNEKLGNVVSSRVIANELGKRHSNVVRDIEYLLSQSQQNKENSNLSSLIFKNNYRVNNQNRTYKEYLLTKDGFTLYMFNIQGYNDFKLAYINEFNKMETALKEIETSNIMIPLSKATQWAKIIEISSNADRVRNRAYKKALELSKSVSRLTDEIDSLAFMTFEVERLIKTLEE